MWVEQAGAVRRWEVMGEPWPTTVGRTGQQEAKLLRCVAGDGLHVVDADTVVDVSPAFALGVTVDLGDGEQVGQVVAVWPGLLAGQEHVYEVLVLGDGRRLLVYESDLLGIGGAG